MDSQEINNEGQVIKKKNLLIKNLLLNIIYEVVNVLVPLVTAPYVSRILLPDGIGIYSYTYSLVTYFVLFAGLGKVGYGIREIAISRDSKEAYSKKFWEINFITFLTSILSLILWMILALNYVEYKIYLLVMTLYILTTMFDISWLYKGLEKFSYTVYINLLCKLLSVVLIFLFIKTPQDVYRYCLILGSSTLLGNISMWIFLPKVVNLIKIDISSTKKHFKNILVYFIPTIAISIYTVLDKTLIGIITKDNAQNGFYEQAIKILTIVKSICFFAINGVMNSRINYLYIKNDREKINSTTEFTFNITLLLSCGACCGLIALSNSFVPLFFGEGYEVTIILMQLLSFLVPVVCISNVLQNVYYIPSGKISKASKYLIAGSIVNLILNIPLIYLYKSVGAAIASIIAELLITILYVFNARKDVSIKMIFKLLWKKIISALLMLIGIMIFNYYVKIDFELINILLQIIIGIVVYILGLVVLRDTSILIVRNAIKTKLLRK